MAINVQNISDKWRKAVKTFRNAYHGRHPDYPCNPDFLPPIEAVKTEGWLPQRVMTSIRLAREPD